jgi:hypothetical protein
MSQFIQSTIHPPGIQWATEATMIVASAGNTGDDHVYSSGGTGDDHVYSSDVEIVDFEAALPAFSLLLHDFYGQDVVTEESSFAQVLVSGDHLPHDCNAADNSGYIGGGIVTKFNKGVALFADVDAFCAPGGVLYLNGTSDKVSNAAVLKLTFRPCVVGGESSPPDS